MPKKRVKPTHTLLEAQSKRISAKPRSKAPKTDPRFAGSGDTKLTAPAPKTRVERDMTLVPTNANALNLETSGQSKLWTRIYITQPIVPPSRWSRLWAWLGSRFRTFRWGRP